MQVRIRVPACWISVSSSLKSMNSVSTTMSAPLRMSTAGRFPESGVLPTVQTPTSPDVADDEYGRRRFIAFAPSRCAGGQERVDVLGALVALGEHDEALVRLRACRAGACARTGL